MVTEHAAREQASPYSGLRVVELAFDPAAEYTGRLLAEMGAEVIKVEEPGGAPSRKVGPFARNIQDGEHSLHFWYYNGDKHSIRLDIATADGMATLDRLLGGADIFISGLRPNDLSRLGLSFEALTDRHPRLIIASVTPFGLTGPWANFKSSDLVSLAAGGPLASCGYDDHSIPPIRPGGNQGYHSAAAYAHIGILLALIERQQSGRGQIVDTSNHEALAVTVELSNPYWWYPRALVQRQTCRHAQPEPTQPALFECAGNRHVFFTLVVTERKPWLALVDWLMSRGLDCGLSDEAYMEVAYRQQNFPIIQQIVESFFLLHDAETMYREGQARGLPIGILNAPEDILQDGHFRQRNFFRGVDHGDVGIVEYPGPAYHFTAFQAVQPRPAPRLGQADDLLDSGQTV